MNKFYTTLQFIFIFFLSTSVHAQISGTVFRDYNSNGTREATTAYTEPMVPGVIVNAYNAADVLIASYTTNSGTGYPYTAPNYFIPAAGIMYSGIPGSNTGFAASGVKVRLEFIIPSSGSCLVNKQYDFSSKSSGGSNTQFVSGGVTNINYAINNPADYVFNAAPFSTTFLFLSAQSTGNPAGGGSSGSQNAFVKIPYNRSGSTPINPTEILATNLQIGTTYGTAYSKYADRIFVSAYMKRHAGFGPADGTFSNAPGAIYIIDPSKRSTTGAASYFTGLDALGIPTHNTTGIPAYGNGSSFFLSSTGAGNFRTETVNYIGAGQAVIGSNTTRNLPANLNTPSNDPAAYGQVGVVSLGDIEISDDGQYLYVTNLYDRRIYQLQLNSITNPTAASVVTSWALPNPPLRSASGIPNAAATYTGANDNTDFYTGTRGLHRPFGLKYYRGKLYAGAVTTGEGPLGSTTKDNNTGNPEYTDLWAYVWELNPAVGFNTTPVIQFPLNFDRSFDANNVDETWNKWTNTMPAGILGTDEYGIPQPMLAGIEFDADGTMILGFRDRAGDQGGTHQNMLSGSDRRTVMTNGDQLRAYKNPAICAFELEQNGKEGPNSPKPATAGANNTQGPGNYAGNNGEFYYQDGIELFNGSANSPVYHANSGQGGLVLLPGNNQTAGTYMDAAGLWTGGISWMSNITGSNTKDYTIQNGSGTGDIGKSNGLGDIEILSKIAPIEIGNRVWEDTDKDGIQDADEPGIAGVIVELFDAAGTTLLGSATTDTGGNFYFNQSNITGGLLPKTGYIVRISNAHFNNIGIGPLLNYIGPTLLHVTGNGTPGFSDNDAVRTGLLVQAAVTTGDYGDNNHNIDFGFVTMPVLAVPDLTEFAATAVQNTSLLKWTTGKEEPGSYFEVLHSADGVNWNRLSVINAKGNSAGSSYAYTDIHPSLTAINYYKLQLIDKAGKKEQSKIQIVNFEKMMQQIKLYSNPVKNNLQLSIPAVWNNAKARFKIYSSAGQLVKIKNSSGTNQTESIPITDLKPGMYILRIIFTETNTTINKSFIKE
jgi:SdrD B-like domain/Secretion system C-terminal sorting domain